MKSKVKGLSDLAHLLHGMKEVVPGNELPKIQLQRVAREDMKAFDENRFEWLVESGFLWIFRVEQKDVSDHAVVVDGVSELFWDSVEEYPLQLRVDVLRKCAGNDGLKSRVVEARRLVLQRRKRLLIEAV